MHTRVFSAYVMVTFGIQRIAALMVGLSAQWFGTPSAIFINGATMFTCVALILIFRKDLRDWEVARPVVAAAPSANP